MSAGQPNAWQSTKGSRAPNSASRTPQNRSSTASPSPQNQTNQSPRQDGGRQQQQSNSSTGGSNGGQSKGAQQQPEMQDGQHIPANGFNASEVRAALAKEPAPAAYKPAEVTGAGDSGGGAWGPKREYRRLVRGEVEEGYSADAVGSKSHGEQPALLRAAREANRHAGGRGVSCRPCGTDERIPRCDAFSAATCDYEALL
ncbi:hypothetical protein LTR74_016852 [Friedmanniomyces endolithicus]|nr:hypothetical protein LTR74_016852 [Friedmanniomyces endolithicus]